MARRPSRPRRPRGHDPALPRGPRGGQSARGVHTVPLPRRAARWAIPPRWWPIVGDHARRGALGVTNEERRRAVECLGFTERQAGFLVTVMLHAGVCLGRHYCTFAQLAYGQKMHDFFHALLIHGYATARPCGHNRARIYHLHGKRLYAAIGEPDNRHRRPTTLARAVE